jgi:hypothetical protein
MGGGTWTACAFRDYSYSVGRSVSDATGEVTTTYASANMAYTSSGINEGMDPRVPKNKMRECRDSEDHPQSIPVILALDVTGSMGGAAIEVSKKLNILVQEANKAYPDLEFMIMGIGDILFDRAPIQYSQFESDIRIAQCLDSIYFESGGGPNKWESYTAAWYVGARRTQCDCWKRGRRGLIVTIGDEEINPRLEKEYLQKATGDTGLQSDVETADIVEEVSSKYALRHVVVNHRVGCDNYFEGCRQSFAKVIGENNVAISNVESIVSVIGQIIKDFVNNEESIAPVSVGGVHVEQSEDGTMGVISWA